MQVSNQVEQARAIALAALERAPRSRAQLEQILEKKGVEAAVASQLLDRFEQVGLVDDRALAETLVRTRHTERGLVGQALAVELRRKGIDPQIGTEAMAGLTAEDQAASAERLAAKKLAATRGLDYQVRLRRALSHLGRKGYPAALALSTVKRLLAEEGARPGSGGA